MKTEFFYTFNQNKFNSIDCKKINFSFLFQLLENCREVNDPTVISLTPYSKELIARNLNWSIKTCHNRCSQEMSKLRTHEIIQIMNNQTECKTVTYELNPDFISIKEISEEIQEPKTLTRRQVKKEQQDFVCKSIGKWMVKIWFGGNLRTIIPEKLLAYFERFASSKPLEDCKQEAVALEEIVRDIRKIEFKS